MNVAIVIRRRDKSFWNFDGLQFLAVVDEQDILDLVKKYAAWETFCNETMKQFILLHGAGKNNFAEPDVV